jgi:hypothetical protein
MRMRFVNGGVKEDQKCLPGTLKVLEENEAASHPVGTSGIALPTFKSVNTAGQIVKGHALYTVKVRAATAAEPMRAVPVMKVAKDFMIGYEKKPLDAVVAASEEYELRVLQVCWK